MPGGGIWGGFGGGGGAPAGGLGGSAPMPAATLASALAITSATFCSAADSLLLSANCQFRKQVQRRRQCVVARLRTRYIHPVLLADTCRKIFIYSFIQVFIYLLKVASSLDMLHLDMLLLLASLTAQGSHRLADSRLLGCLSRSLSGFC